MADLDQALAIPIHGLGSRSLGLLSAGLRVQHAIPGRNNYSRDWRVLAQLILPHDTLVMLLDSADPVRQTLKLWPKEASVGQLIRAMEGIERYDVIEDCIESILEDCRSFLKRREDWNSEPSLIQLTIFQAFVIHALEDIEFVKEMVLKVEEAGMSLFIPARDFPAAEHNYMYSLVEIMQQRCHKVIVVVSQALAKDKDAITLVEDAERIHAQERSGKLIPIIIESCPRIGFLISTVSKILFNVPQARDWAWPRLLEALRSGANDQLNARSDNLWQVT